MSTIYQAVIFDLDGTLLNTLTDLTNSANHILNSLDLPTHPQEAYRYFVGNGIEKLVERMLPAGQEKYHEEALHLLRSYYSEHWADTSAPYDGIPQLLDSLSSKHIPFAVLSNKPEGLTKANVHHFLKKWQFSDVAGATAEFLHKPDKGRALVMAQKLNVRPKNILFVGDSSIDMQTANNAGMVAIGATWGFRTAEELQENGAHALISHPLELLENFKR